MMNNTSFPSLLADQLKGRTLDLPLQLLFATARPGLDIMTLAYKGADLILRNTAKGVASVVGFKATPQELDEHTSFTQTKGRATRILTQSRPRARMQNQRRAAPQQQATIFNIGSATEGRSRFGTIHARVSEEERLPLCIGLQASML